MMPTPTQVWLVVEPIDMRAGMDGLSQRIQTTLERSPCDGSAYAFSNRRRNRLKLLVWDGTGVWLCQRRLHQGHFTWPSSLSDLKPTGSASEGQISQCENLRAFRAEIGGS